MSYRFETAQWVPVEIEHVFRFFANPANLPRIMPPWAETQLVRLNLVLPPGVHPVLATATDKAPIAGAGSEIVSSFRIFPYLPFRQQGVALITEFEWNHYFCDTQKKGPFKSFHHRHELTQETREGRDGTVVRDVIEYEVGFGLLGALAQKLFVERQLGKTFAHRQKEVEQLLSAASQ